MSLGEFDLIKRYFNALSQNDDVAIGIGDDCAILDVPEGYQLAVTTDTLVAGVHFFEDVDPYKLGYKSLAVNLSDLAAMGALPKWVSLAITLPSIDEKWISEFTRGFFKLAKQYNISLVGGDTTKGPLSITVSAKGIVERHKALLRSTAQPEELICVSGVLGDGAVGLDCKLGKLQLTNSAVFIDALECTEPRNHLGMLLTKYASSCIDISDGLIQDLQHILNLSCCNACIDIDKLPLSVAMQIEIENKALNKQQAIEYALTGGDDYELLFTIDKIAYDQLTSKNSNTLITVIGHVTQNTESNIKFIGHDTPILAQLSGWDHFK